MSRSGPSMLEISQVNLRVKRSISGSDISLGLHCTPPWRLQMEYWPQPISRSSTWPELLLHRDRHQGGTGFPLRRPPCDIMLNPISVNILSDRYPSWLESERSIPSSCASSFPTILGLHLNILKQYQPASWPSQKNWSSLLSWVDLLLPYYFFHFLPFRSSFSRKTFASLLPSPLQGRGGGEGKEIVVETIVNRVELDSLWNLNEILTFLQNHRQPFPAQVFGLKLFIRCRFFVFRGSRFFNPLKLHLKLNFEFLPTIFKKRFGIALALWKG